MDILCLPYTIGDYLSDDIRTGPISTDSIEFELAESNVKRLLNQLISNKGNHSVDYYHKKLGKIMWDKCGMARTEIGLKRSNKRNQRIKRRFLEKC